MRRYCRNCHFPLPEDAHFCPDCGQKNSDGRITMRSMLVNLWTNTFHLEGKFIRTCWQLFIPAKVTIETFKGRQSRYPHPLRMFAIVMFFFLLVFNQMFGDRPMDSDGASFTISDKVELEDGTKTVRKTNLTNFDKIKYKVMVMDMQHYFDSLPDYLKTPVSREAMDSVLAKSSVKNGITNLSLLDSLGEKLDTTTIVLLTSTKLRIATIDLVRYTPEEIIQLYGIKGWFDKILVKQTAKSFKNPTALVNAVLGSMTWTILAQVSFMAILLSLLFWKQKRYFVEHFLFLLHYHTGLMLALLLVLAGKALQLWGGLMVVLWVVWALAALYLAMRRFYNKSTLKALGFWLVFTFLYVVSFIVLFSVGMLLVFALY
ncbi:MAG: DUF3667 domain-containing protein [Saprospiraceae bacterium]|nr:DUF3667 domain-containing protein [Saprospiraceae bacterium]